MHPAPRPARRAARRPLAILFALLLTLTSVPAAAGAPAAAGPPRAQAATFQVDYSPDFPDEAKAAFQAGVDVWATRLTTGVPIRVTATWKALGSCEAGCTLAAAGPATMRRNFPNAPFADTDYPIALANKFAGGDLDPALPDIQTEFNSQVNWFYGAGPVPPGQNNFISTVAHELAHGLGFITSFTYNGGVGGWGDGDPVVPQVMDRYIVNGSAQRLVDTTLFPNNSAALGAQLTSDNVFFDGPAARAANGGTPVKIFAPNPWKQGSSLGHLDQATYPDTGENGMMTPDEGAGTPNTPGPITEAIFRDLGWGPPGAFGDVPADDAAAGAIQQLTTRGIIRGCDPTGTPPLYCPKATTLRMQMAALIVRAMPGWQDETYTNTFTDPPVPPDDELWRRVATLQHYGVAGGYNDCPAQGKTAPCYGPLDPVLRAQAISFVTRAMVKKGYWENQPVNPALYGGALAGTGHDADAATYWHYTRARGGVPDYPESGPFPTTEPAPRDWFARLLWQALQGSPAAP